MKASDFRNILSEKSALVDKEIVKIMPRDCGVPNLQDAAWYALSAGGKRLRPTMCLLVAEALNGDMKQALRFGVAIELLHNFLLVHDDIEDGDLVRRNSPAVWVKYGLPHGINIGDFLLAQVYRSISSLRQLDVKDSKIVDLLDEVTNCLIETGEGQAIEINARLRTDLTEDEYLQIVRKKTAAYLTIPMIGAAIIAGAPDNILSAIRRYGHFVGPAFQIIDDAIDLTEGKGRGEKGCDIKEGKPSFMVVHVANKCTETEKTKLFEILKKPREMKTASDISWVTDLFEKYDAISIAQKKAADLVGQGKEAISSLPIHLRNVLNGLADFAVERSI